MKNVKMSSKALMIGALLVLTTISCGAAVLTGSGIQVQPKPGTTRGDSYPVKVVVKLNDQPVAGITVTAMVKNSATAVTDENGIAAFTLIPGTYTFSASNDSGSATTKSKVVASTKPLIVQLALAPKAQ